MKQQNSILALSVGLILALGSLSFRVSHMMPEPLPNDCSVALTQSEIAVLASLIHNGPDDDENVRACIEEMSDADADAVFENYAALEGLSSTID